jgi:hypothetical protein
MEKKKYIYILRVSRRNSRQILDRTNFSSQANAFLQIYVYFVTRAIMVGGKKVSPSARVFHC